MFSSFQYINLTHLFPDLSLHVSYIYAIKDILFSFLISDYPSLLYRYKIDFSMSILHLTTLPNFLVLVALFFVDSIELST